MIVFTLPIADAGQAAVHNYAATLEGSQVVPPTSSGATGSGLFSIDDVANTVTYSISYSGLMGVETAAHIHGMAPPGANAGVVHALPAGEPKNGVWNYTEAQEVDILAGRTYVNIHTTLFPGGEIRGQIVMAEPLGCRLNCPALDGGLINEAGLGNHSPDLDSSGDVSVTDFAIFATDFGQPGVCTDFDCTGMTDIVDFAIFAGHYLHGAGPAGVCE